MMNFSNHKVKNIAIIAHVDHGKTTLVDAIFRQSGLFRSNQNMDERVMDSNAIEKERGITILSKSTSINWKDYIINIIDTPGHADFGAEVERVLSVVDGFILLVDSVEGVMPQTKFVLNKAMEAKLKPIVVVNKIDRPLARSTAVVDEVMDLMFSMDPDAIECPFFFASGRDGYASKNLDKAPEIGNIYELLDEVINYIPDPKIIDDNKSRAIAFMKDKDLYFGNLLICKIFSGKFKIKDNAILLDQSGKELEKKRITKLFKFIGISKQEVDSVSAGDIAVFAGLEKGTVNDNIILEANTSLIIGPAIDAPIMSVTISVNNSPFAGQEGTKLTSKQIVDRILNEADTNVGIKVKSMNDSCELIGRGELQLGIIMENMRREGFEFTVSSPKIILKEKDGKKLEPLEEVSIDVEVQHMGTVIEKLTSRGGELKDTKEFNNAVRLVFNIPSRAILSYNSELVSDTKGTGIMSKRLIDYIPYKGEVKIRNNGVLVSTDSGTAKAYSMDKLKDRGIFFIQPGDQIYKGMIVGENSKGNDLPINPVKAKHLTNMRASGKDEGIYLSPPKVMTLENAITYIQLDESIEVTPNSIRLRKNSLKVL